MTEYIEREAVKEKIERLRDKCGNNEMAFALNWAVSLTGKIPAADVAKIVRCGECKHWFDNGTDLCSCDRDALLRRRDFFCADGERRNNG